MEIHQLRYFIALHKNGSFTGAAQACNISQPSLSAQIKKLEEELGGKLIERNRKNCRLSPRGSSFLPRALEILRQVELSFEEARDFDSARRGSIRLGCLPTTGAFILPPILVEYRTRFPEIDISIQEGSSPALAASLQNNEVEVAIMDEAGLRPGMNSIRLLREPLFIALPPDHELAERDELSLSDLRDEPLILMRKGHGFYSIVESALGKAGVSPVIVYQSSEIETVQALVRAGLGISLVPRMICHHADITYRPIEHPAPCRTLLLTWRKEYERSPAVLRFFDIASIVLAQHFGTPNQLGLRNPKPGGK